MTDQQPSSLSGAVKRGALWVVLERGVLQALNLAGSVILARLLAPQDFGVMALSFVVTGLSSRLLHTGFGMALVQRESIRPDHVSTMFVLSLAINIGLFLLVSVIAPYVGAYFGNPLVGDVLEVMALTFVIRAFGVCPTALLRRRMDFRSRTTGSVIDATGKIVTATALAVSGFGVWSLAYGEIAGAVAEKCYLIWVSRWRPGLRVTRSAVRDLFGFGLGLSLKSTVIYLTERIDNVIVGKWLGTAALGLYEKAYNLMDVPVRELGARMNVVLFPAFARMQDDRGRLRAAYRKTVLSMALVTYPLFAGLAMVAPEFIGVVYGAKWMPAVLPFQILCLAGPPRVLAQVTGSLLNAMGMVGSEVKARSVSLVLLVGAVAVGTRWGVAGVAAGVAVINFATLGMILTVARRRTGLGAREVLQPQAVPLAGMGALVVASLVARSVAAGSWGLPAVAVGPIVLAAGGAAYLAVVYAWGDVATRALVEELKVDVRRFTGGLVAAGRAKVRRSARAAG